MLPQTLAYSPEAHSDFIWAVVGSPWTWLLCWVLLMSVITFFTFGVDKWKAKRTEKNPAVRRIPEKNLFLLAILGGSPGALLGMKVWHHKTLHRSFRIGIPAILITEAALILGLVIYFQFIR